MAQYERDFLVPYLEDLCALYMCERVLRRKVFETTRDIVEIEAQPIMKAPPAPKCPGPWESGSGKRIIVSAILFLLSFWIISSTPGHSGPLERLVRGAVNTACGIVMIISPIALISGIVKEIAARREYNEAWASYNAQMEIYHRIRKRTLENKDKQRVEILPQIKADNERYSKDLDTCLQLLEQTYDADVIPSKYRDQYAIMYLYDWFKHNRRADDLDLALNTFVLEQIKDKLDKMIDQLETVILNQRITIANQRASMEEQRRHHAYMEQKVRSMIANQEEQKQYMEMIESNTAVSSYIHTLDYIRNS